MAITRFSADSALAKLNFSEPFDAKKHEGMIIKQIEHFKKTYEEIQKTDHAFMVPTLASIALFIFNSPTWGVVMLASLYLGNHSLRQPYQDALNRLMKIYVWCGQSGPEVTTQNSFIQLLTTLAPFVSTQELMLWPTQEFDKLSHEYKKILHVKNPNIKFEKESSHFFSRLLGSKNPNPPKEKTIYEDNPDLKKSLKQASNALWFHFYGHKSRTEQALPKVNLSHKLC